MSNAETWVKSSQPTRKKILLLDDDASILRAFGRMLRRQGFDVVAVQITTHPDDNPDFLRPANPDEIAHIITEEKPAAIVTDFKMNLQSNMFTGEDVLAIAKRVAPQIPVLLNTADIGAPAAHDDESRIATWKKEGFSAVGSKLDINAIPLALNEIIGQHGRAL